jgi:hypothetical protein
MPPRMVGTIPEIAFEILISLSASVEAALLTISSENRLFNVSKILKDMIESS